MVLIRGWDVRGRAVFLVAFLLTTIAVSLRVFTQREHFVLVATIPYVLLCGARERGEKVTAVLAVSVGTLGALGFALKPFFAIVPIALELWLWRKTPRLRPETVSLAALAILYGSAVMLFEQDFLAAVPMISTAYRYFIGTNYNGFLIPFVLFALAFVPTAKSDGGPTPFMIAALAYLLTFFIQGKAWSYQALPAIGMLLLALARLPLGRSAAKDGVALGIALTALILNARPYPTERPFLFPPGSSVATLSVTTQPSWPQVEERGYHWPLHAFSLWQLGAIDSGVLPAGPLQRKLAHDLGCHPPDYLLVDQVEPVQAFVHASPELRMVLSHYRPVVVRSGMQLMRRTSPFEPPSHGCRPIYSASARP
jgi:hypothetical protein